MKRKNFRLLSLVLAAVLVLAMIPVSAPRAQAATQNQLNIVARADYMYDSTWVCKKTTTCCAYGSYYTFYEGTTYRIPYGQNTSTGAYIGYGVSVDTFLSAAANASSVYYTTRGTNGYNGYYSLYYATDCSGFVSYCWDATYKQSTRSLAGISSYIGDVTTYNCTWNLQLGDALNRYDYHVVLVTGLSYDSSGAITQIEITESTIPTLKRSYYTPSELADKYSSYDGIYRYYGTVDPAPNSDHWERDSTGWYYEYADGSWAVGWTHIDGKWYYFSQSGYMFTGWLYDESNQGWYFLDPETGIMQTGWICPDGYYYYLNSSGKMLTGWQMIDGSWFYLNTTDKWPVGAMFTGFHEIDGKMYYFNELSDGTRGAMRTGWVNVEGYWYYFDSAGAMLYGWQTIDGKQYHLDEESGIMSAKAWLYKDGVWIYVNASGAVTEGAVWNGVFEDAMDIGTGFYATIDIPLTGTRVGADSDPASATYQNVEVQAVRTEDAADYNEQLWYFERREDDGSYRITNAATGMVLDQVGGYVDRGTNVRVCPDYDSLAQRWFVYANGDHYGFVTGCSAWDMTVLDVADGLGDEGTNIRIWSYNGSGAQQFMVNRILEPAVTAKSASLSFEDEVLINLYFTTTDLPDVTEEDMGLLTWTSQPDEGTIEDAHQVLPGAVYDAEKSRYMVQTQGIPAKNLGDDIYMRVYAKLTDGTYVYSDLVTYSPKKYAMSRLEKSTSEQQKALCVAMLNYGAAAQVYFGYKTERLMNADLTDEQLALVSAYSADLFTGVVAVDSTKVGAFTQTETGFSKKSATVSFDGAFAINYYFTPSAQPVGEVIFYYWTPDVYAAAAELTADNASGVLAMEDALDGRYWAEVTGIAAKDLDKTYYVAGVYTDEGGNTCCTGVVAYSLSKYCMNNAKDGNAMQELAANTAMYGYYAAQYFG